MSDRAAPAVIVALLAGACGAVQPKVNAILGARAGSSLVASLVNFLVALSCVVVALVFRSATRTRLRAIRTWPVPRWTLTAGLGGAIVVLAGVVTVEAIGVAVFSVAFFAGQIAFGLVVDRLGVGPGGERPLTPARVQAAALAIAAVGVAQAGRPLGELAPLLVLFVMGSGAAVAFQSAFNGRITAATGDPVTATAVNVAVGTAALGAIILALGAMRGFGPVAWPAEPWLYSGGALGVTIVLSLAIATAALGVLRATVTMLAAQLVAAFGVDWVVVHTRPTLGVVAGAALIVGAVALVARRTVPNTP